MDYISINNVPIPLSERISADKKCKVFVCDYCWIIFLNGYYEFYYTPTHFIGKILKEQMPNLLIERLYKFCVAFNGSDFCNIPSNSKVYLLESDISLRSLELNIGNWYYYQGEHYITMNNKFICNEKYISNSEKECAMKNIDLPIVNDMLYMSCRTRTPYYYRNIFEFPLFHDICVDDLTIYDFKGKFGDKMYCRVKLLSLKLFLFQRIMRNT